MVFAFGNHRPHWRGTMQLTKQLADYFGISDGKGCVGYFGFDEVPA